MRCRLQGSCWFRLQRVVEAFDITPNALDESACRHVVAQINGACKAHQFRAPMTFYDKTVQARNIPPFILRVSILARSA